MAKTAARCRAAAAPEAGKIGGAGSCKVRGITICPQAVRLDNARGNTKVREEARLYAEN
jgi:hypothetical protein